MRTRLKAEYVIGFNGSSHELWRDGEVVFSGDAIEFVGRGFGSPVDRTIDYGRALDKRDFVAYGRLFAKAGTWKGGMGSATTPQGIQKMVEDGFGKMSPDLYENSNHVMTSMDIEVHGDTATSWSRWLWVVKGADGKPRTERGGHYEDVLIRENGLWRFKIRQAFNETG